MTKTISLIEVPETKITDEINGKEEVYSAVRTNYPKQSQLILGGLLKDLLNVKIIDMKISDKQQEKQYHEFKYGNGKIKCYRIGADFKSVKENILNSDYIGLTSNFTRSSRVVTDFIKFSKKINPKIKIILGGSDATPRYKYYLENGADFIILGEGEKIILNLVNALILNTSVEKITGIAYKKNNKIIYNQRSSNDAVSIDGVPFPAFDLVKNNIVNYNEAFQWPIPKGVKSPFGILETSRGCMEACPFCTTPFLRKNYRYVSTNYVERLLDHYKKYGFQTLLLMEDNILSRLKFKGGRENLIEMFDLMSDKGFAWEFGNGIEFGELMKDGKIDTELIEKLFYHNFSKGKYIGCYRVCISLESLCANPEKVYKKLKSYKEELKIIDAIVSTSVPMMSFATIIGLPNETKKDLELIEEKALEIKNRVEKFKIKTDFLFFFNTLFPGTINFKKYQNVLRYDINSFPELFHFHTATCNTKDSFPPELTLLKREMEKRINGKKATQQWAKTGHYSFG